MKRDPRPAILARLEPSLRAQWNPRRTAAQNYAEMGLATHVSAPKDLAVHAPGLLAGALGGAVSVEWADLPSASEVAAGLAAGSRNLKRSSRHVSSEDIVYAAALRRAHPGPLTHSLYAKMSRDITVNWRQLTEEKIAGLLDRVQARKDATSAVEASITSSAPAVTGETTAGRRPASRTQK